MKKTEQKSEEALPGQPSPGDYVVGQVCGSLLQKKKKKSAASGSLASLFSSSAAAGPLFQPAPKLVQKSTETKEPPKLTPEVKGQPQKKKLKEKTEGDQKLEDREMSLQTADEEEGGQGKTKTKRTRTNKRKAAEPGGDSDAEQWVMKRQRLKARKEEEAMKSKRTVFIGNLPISCTRKTLQSLFRDKGSIESVRFRSVVREDPAMSRKVAAIQRRVHPKKQSINAYVVFKDEDGVSRALERNGMEIEKDFHIRVDRVTDNSAHDHKRSVFVGNLSFEISEVTFRRHFEKCGPVEAVRLVRDQNSGLGKGFGYVLFESADSVQLALELDGSTLEARAIRVKRSVKKEKKKNKTDRDGAVGRPGRGPGPETGGRRGGFRSPKKSPGAQRGSQSSGSFRGEMVDRNKKDRKKGLKKKTKKNKKTVHI